MSGTNMWRPRKRLYKNEEWAIAWISIILSSRLAVKGARGPRGRLWVSSINVTLEEAFLKNRIAISFLLV